jgi:hypothetical protein
MSKEEFLEILNLDAYFNRTKTPEFSITKHEFLNMLIDVYYAIQRKDGAFIYEFFREKIGSEELMNDEILTSALLEICEGEEIAEDTFTLVKNTAHDLSNSPNGIDSAAFIKSVLKWSLGFFGIGPLGNYFSAEKEGIQNFYITKLNAPLVPLVEEAKTKPRAVAGRKKK